MSNNKTINIPDIGGATDVDVIEILVNVGDVVEKNTPLVTLESDKASMEIPSPSAGTIQSIIVKLGDKVSEGDALLVLAMEEQNTTFTPTEEPAKPSEKTTPLESPSPATAPASALPQFVDVVIPDIGGATDVDVIDILIKKGDVIEKDQSLITLEGDKATMDIPSPYAGTVEAIMVACGDKVSQGHLIVTMHTQTSTANQPTPPEPQTPVVSHEPRAPEKPLTAPVNGVHNERKSEASSVLAGPSVRRLARELGVRLDAVKGTGRKQRIMKEDILAYVKAKLNAPASSESGFALPKQPAIDFSVFGEIDTKPLNKIKRLTGANVHRSWVSIPHVTQFDEADITELEQFRKEQAKSAEAQGYKLTLLAFVTKVVQKALQAFPQFNASLDASGEQLIYKQYYNIGIAVETPNGLVVPVIKQVDTRDVSDIAKEMARLSTKAREKGLMPSDMNGGCMTISSLGGIGGTGFTPIVNAPEVAILGLSRSSIQPKYEHGQWVPRLMLPLSLSYDHRVIDGAEAARFTRYIAEMLEDIRCVLL